MKRSYGWFVDLMNNRPLCLLGAMFSLRDLLLSIAFILATPDITQTLLYQNIADIMPTTLFGIVFGLICTVTLVAAIAEKTKITRVGLDIQAFVWLFSGFVYVWSGAWFLALIFGLLFSAPSGYISYYYKYRSLWDAKKEVLRQEHGWSWNSGDEAGDE